MRSGSPGVASGLITLSFSGLHCVALKYLYQPQARWEQRVWRLGHGAELKDGVIYEVEQGEGKLTRDGDPPALPLSKTTIPGPPGTGGGSSHEPPGCQRGFYPCSLAWPYPQESSPGLLLLSRPAHEPASKGAHQRSLEAASRAHGRLTKGSTPTQRNVRRICSSTILRPDI